MSGRANMPCSPPTTPGWRIPWPCCGKRRWCAPGLTTRSASSWTSTSSTPRSPPPSPLPLQTFDYPFAVVWVVRSWLGSVVGMCLSQTYPPPSHSWRAFFPLSFESRKSEAPDMSTNNIHPAITCSTNTPMHQPSTRTPPRLNVPGKPHSFALPPSPIVRATLTLSI